MKKVAIYVFCGLASMQGVHGQKAHQRGRGQWGHGQWGRDQWVHGQLTEGQWGHGQWAKLAEQPISSCKPKGWMLEFLRRQEQGLTGHPEVLSYPFNSCLWAGVIAREGENHGDNWWRYEQTAYYSDGLLRLGYLLADTALIHKGEDGIDYTLAHPRADGRLGPGLFPSQWPIAVYFRALQAEYQASGDGRIVEALHKHYLTYSHDEIGMVRRNVVNIEGMLWTYGLTGDLRLLALAEKAYAMGGFELNQNACLSPDKLVLHGVTYMEMAKLPAILYAYTGKKIYLDAALNAFAKLNRDHMLPDGVPSSNEFLAGKDPLQSHETCDIADYTWSLGYLLMTTGNARWADDIEKAVFNAGPGCVSKDFKNLQYFSSVNQVIATGTSNHNKFAHGSTWMAYWPCHETECCAGNVHRIMPNYAARMWMRDSAGGVVAALYGPAELRVEGAPRGAGAGGASNGRANDGGVMDGSASDARATESASDARATESSSDGRVTESASDGRASDAGADPLAIKEETNYPFSDVVDFSFELPRAKEMPFTVRIPGWCKRASVQINGKPYTGRLEPGSFVTLRRVWRAGDKVKLRLPMEASVRRWGSWGGYVSYGPLVFSYPVPEKVSIDTATYANLLGKRSANPAFPALDIRPAGDWNYAIVDDDIKVVQTGSTGYPFDPGSSPIVISVPVRRVKDWGLIEGRYTPSMPEKVEMEGDSMRVQLAPYGSTRLRMTVFPMGGPARVGAEAQAGTGAMAGGQGGMDAVAGGQGAMATEVGKKGRTDAEVWKKGGMATEVRKKGGTEAEIGVKRGTGPKVRSERGAKDRGGTTGPRLNDTTWKFGNFGENAGGQLSAEKSKLTLTTRKTPHAFFESDAYSFAYRKVPFPYDDCSMESVAVTIPSFTIGAAGIMMRASLRNDAANVHLEVGPTGDLLLFWRREQGQSTSYTRIAALSFPMQLKLVRQGDVFTPWYKDEKGQWVKGTSAMASVGSQPLVGFYACSGSDSQIGYSSEANAYMQVSFVDMDLKYQENFIPAEKNFKDTIVVKAGTLLRDNFNDGDLSNGPASVTNPVWNGITYGYLPHDKTGGRYWRKTGDGIFYLGNKKWADYQIGIDLSFDAESKAPSELLLQLRYQNISVYAKMARYYAAGVRDGDKLFFEKYESGAISWSKVVTIPKYFNGSKHRVEVRFLDREYEVFYDGKKLIGGVDTVRPITYGNIALKFTNVLLNMDNLEVLQVEDPINGDKDNYLQDYYDTPLPAYLKQYEK